MNRTRSAFIHGVFRHLLIVALATGLAALPLMASAQTFRARTSRAQTVRARTARPQTARSQTASAQKPLRALPHSNEQQSVFDLAPDAAVDVRAVKNGQWDSPDTWGGELPSEGDDVLIPRGRIVLLDHREQAGFNTVRVDGVLEFAPTEDTLLRVDTLVVTPSGKLEIGSQVSPIQNRAELRFLDDGPLTSNLSRGLVSLGMVSIHGQPGEFVKAVEQDGDEWRPQGPNPRTVTIASENEAEDRRGHVMLMHHPEYSVGWARFLHLGRTKKAIPVSDDNARGRYPLHFHRCGLDKAISVQGVVIEHSPGWGLVNHSSHVVATDSITYDVLGSGFVTEAGDERGAFRNCLAVKSAGSGQDRHKREGIGDFAHSGHGFWLQGPDVAMLDNMAVGHRHAAFFVFAKGFKEPDTRQFADRTSMERPMAPYERNVAKSSSTGHSFEWVSRGTSEYSTMRDCYAYDCLTGANMREASVNVVGGEFIGKGSSKGAGVVFIGPYRGKGGVYNASISNFGRGVEVATRVDSAVVGCTFSGNGKDVFVSNQLGARLTLDNNGNAKYWFDNSKLSQHSYDAFWKKRNEVWIDGKLAYFDSQRPDFVRYPKDGPYAGMTNQQIFDRYGWLPMGAFVPPHSIAKETYWLATDTTY